MSTIDEAPGSHATLPGFSDATTLRQRAMAAGPDPAYWYPVEWDRALAKGQVREVTFWGQSFALYRGEDGEAHVLENRCAHRQVKLSSGWVDGCRLKCVYHGWTYDPDGRLAAIPHELFGKPFPSASVRSYPVKERYGILWAFFGDPALAASRPIPHIPELEGEAPWVCVPVDFLWNAHSTMIVNNVMDSTHVETLHSRRFQTRSFLYGKVTHCDAEGDVVKVGHTIEVDKKGLVGYLAGKVKIPKQEAVYDYPHLAVSVGGVFKLWNLLLPIDERTTRIFLLSLSERVKVPFTPLLAPRWLDRLILPFAERVLVRPLFEEDGWSTALEQEGYENGFRHPSIDLHPAPRLCYQLIVRKWEEHLARQAQASGPVVTLRRGAEATAP